jgi:hypothetical protein
MDFGASKKQRLSASQQGRGVSTGCRCRWCRINNPPVEYFTNYAYACIMRIMPVMCIICARIICNNMRIMREICVYNMAYAYNRRTSTVR